MARKRDPRIPPLRLITDTYREPADGNRVYANLECGHTAATTGTAGQGTRMRCTTCRHEILKGKRDVDD